MRVILPRLTVLEIDDDMHVNFVSNKSHDVTPNPTVLLTTISVSIAYRLAYYVPVSMWCGFARDSQNV